MEKISAEYSAAYRGFGRSQQLLSIETGSKIAFDPDNTNECAVSLMINTSSLELIDDVRASDRREINRVMFDEILEKHRYPKISYQSSRVTTSKITENAYKVSVARELTLHGATQGVGLDSQISVGEDSIRAQGTFPLRQSDFGLKLAAVAGGTITVRDELKCAYFIIGRRKAA